MRPGCVLGAPRFQPRPDALLKVGNNALGNAGVNVFSFAALPWCLSFIVFAPLDMGFMHMQPLPTGEVGGSKAQGRRAGRGITQAAQARLKNFFLEK